MSSNRRKKRLEAKLGPFLRQYGRKAHPGFDPNDRGYDRDFERKVKNMDPLELDELMNGAPLNLPDSDDDEPGPTDEAV